MKKHLFALAFSLCLFGSVFAQEGQDKLKILDIHIGPSISNFLNSEALNKGNWPYDFDYQTSIIRDAQTNLSFGLGLEYYIKNNLSLYFALNYDRKGMHISYKDSGTGDFVYEKYFDAQFKNAYLTLPINIRKYIANQKFYLQTGVYTSYLISAKQLITKEATFSALNSYYEYYDSKYKPYTNNLDFGVSLGAGINYPLNENLYLKIDYNTQIGMRKVDKKHDNDTWEVYGPYGYSSVHYNYYGFNSRAKNISMALTFGLGFRL